MNILLHSTKGVNPRLTVCQRCGVDVGVALIGTREYKDICDKPGCGCVHYGGADSKAGRYKECGKCGGTSFTRKPIEDHEKLPGGLCSGCESELREHRNVVVNEGGVYWQCGACRASGAMRKNELADAVRKHASKDGKDYMAGPPYLKIGAQFDATDCPVCGPNKVLPL